MDLLLSCSNPQRVFTIFYQLCSEEKDTRPFLELKCDQNHGFCKLLLQLARKLFNMFAKNYSKEINSMLHKKSPTKRASVNVGQSCSKVKKLQSK